MSFNKKGTGKIKESFEIKKDSKDSKEQENDKTKSDKK